MKRSRLFIANIVLGSVLAVLACICIFVMFVFRAAFEEVEREYDAYGWEDYYNGSWDYDDSSLYDYDDWDYDDSWSYDYDDWDYDGDWDYGESWDTGIYYTIPLITGASAELIGPSYQDQEAEEGYQYYKVTMQVHNAGTDYIIADYMDLTISGEEYGDVYRYHEPYSDEMNDFEYSNLQLIPSCQTATVSVVIEVKDTVEDVMIEIYPDYGNGETASYVLNLR